MFAGMYPVTKEDDDELSSVDPHYFYRYKYRFPDPVRSDIMFNNTLANKIYVRNKLISNFDLDIVIKDPHLKHSMDNLNIIKHYTITKDLPKLLEQKKQKRNNVRLEICRIMNKFNLPADLTPTICAFAVPHSKIYNYM